MVDGNCFFSASSWRRRNYKQTGHSKLLSGCITCFVILHNFSHQKMTLLSLSPSIFTRDPIQREAATFAPTSYTKHTDYKYPHPQKLIVLCHIALSLSLLWFLPFVRRKQHLLTNDGQCRSQTRPILILLTDLHMWTHGILSRFRFPSVFVRAVSRQLVGMSRWFHVNFMCPVGLKTTEWVEKLTKKHNSLYSFTKGDANIHLMRPSSWFRLGMDWTKRTGFNFVFSKFIRHDLDDNVNVIGKSIKKR